MTCMKHVTQEERLDYLVEEFKTDSGEYRIQRAKGEFSDHL